MSEGLRDVLMSGGLAAIAVKALDLLGSRRMSNAQVTDLIAKQYGGLYDRVKTELAGADARIAALEEEASRQRKRAVDCEKHEAELTRRIAEIERTMEGRS